MFCFLETLIFLVLLFFTSAYSIPAWADPLTIDSFAAAASLIGLLKGILIIRGSRDSALSKLLFSMGILVSDVGSTFFKVGDFDNFLRVTF
jgi:hypothetical protein